MATAEGKGRKLTAGEILMVRYLFQTAIDVTRVRVYNKKFIYIDKIQDDDTAMAPNGKIYFPKGLFLEDFSLGDDASQHLFMHEMSHVYQTNMGIPVWLIGLGSGTAKYKYDYDATKQLIDYGMEQQCEILADYYALTKLGFQYWSQKKEMTNSQVLSGSPGRAPTYSEVLAGYQSLLKDFLKDPVDTMGLYGVPSDVYNMLRFY